MLSKEWSGTMLNLEEKAKSLLLKYSLTDTPINPVRLAEHLGIEIHCAKYFDPSLMSILVRRDGKQYITVNEKMPPLHIKYVVAREVARSTLLGYQDGDITDNTYIPSDFTDEVSCLAVTLLVPYDILNKFWRQTESLEILTAIFKVSDEVMVYRLKALGWL